MSTFIGPPTQQEWLNNQPAGSSASQGNTNKGAAWNNIGTGLGNFFSGLFGNNGASDELAVILNRQGGYYYDPNSGGYPGYNPRQQGNGILFVVVAIIIIVVLYFVLKK